MIYTVDIARSDILFNVNLRRQIAYFDIGYMLPISKDL